MKDRTTRVLIADDQALIRHSIASMLNALAGDRIEIVGSVANGLDAIERFAEFDADVVFLDIEMPELDGVECVKAMKMQQPDVRIAIVSGVASGPMGVDAISAGADYILDKAELTPDTIRALMVDLELVDG